MLIYGIAFILILLIVAVIFFVKYVKLKSLYLSQQEDINILCNLKLESENLKQQQVGVCKDLQFSQENLLKAQEEVQELSNKVLNYQVTKEHLASIKAELEALHNKSDSELHTIKDLQQKLDQTTTNKQELFANVAAKESALTEKSKFIDELKIRLSSANQKIDQLQEKNAETEATIAKLSKQLEEQQKQAGEKLQLLENAKGQLATQFENLANKIFEERGNAFVHQNKTNINDVIKPLQQQIGSFAQKIETLHSNADKERSSLKGEVSRLMAFNLEIDKATKNLTNALKGDKQKQGAWGEMILEKVLENSGLIKGQHYDIQSSFKDADNNTFRPDVIVKLPDHKNVIIDSKVSLNAYEAYVNAKDTDDKKDKYLKQHIEAVKKHIDTLSNKKYEDLIGANQYDFVLMFMPIEPSFILAFQHNNKLFVEAFKKKIVVVTPTTLMATLGTINNIWSKEKQNKNAQEISNRASLLLEKFIAFVENFEKIKGQLEKLHTTYDTSMNQLKFGRGNLVSQAIKLQSLGVQIKKELPKSVTDSAEVYLNE